MNNCSGSKEGTFSINAFILLLILLATMNFFGKYYYFFVMAFFSVLFCYHRTLKISAEVVVEFSLGLSLLIFSGEALSITNLIKPFVYFMGGIIGCNFLRDSDFIAEQEKSLYKMAGALALGAWFHLLFNMLINSKSVGYRTTIDVWTHKAYGATGQAGLGVLAVALSISGLFSKKEKNSKIVSLVVLTVVLSYNLILAGRTLLAVFFVEAGVAFVSVLYVNKDRMLKHRMLLIVVCAICCMTAIYSMNLLNIRGLVEETTFYQRFFSGNYSQKIVDDDRLTYKLFYLRNMDRHLLGGTHLRSELGHYAHDLLLDGYDIGGSFTLIMLFILLLMSAKNLFQAVFNKSLRFETKLLVICYFCSFYIEFCIEPILAGFQWLFTAFCIFNAVLNKFNRKQNFYRRDYVIECCYSCL